MWRSSQAVSRAKTPSARVLGRQQLHLVAGGHRRSVDRRRRPCPSGGGCRPGSPTRTGSRRRVAGSDNAGVVEQATVARVQRALAAPLAVPERELAVVVAVARDGLQVDAVAPRRVAHGQERASPPRNAASTRGSSMSMMCDRARPVSSSAFMRPMSLKRVSEYFASAASQRTAVRRASPRGYDAAQVDAAHTLEIEPPAARALSRTHAHDHGHRAAVHDTTRA